jgi:hypothetical protein
MIYRFLSHIIRVTGEETWVSFVNVVTEEQSNKWSHTHSPNKPQRFKLMSVCQRVDGNYFLKQERSTDGGICATRDYNNI